MERVRVGDLNDGPYGGARFLYNNDSNGQQKPETVDLLRMVPSMNRPGILKHGDNTNGNNKEVVDHSDIVNEQQAHVNINRANNARRGSRKSLGDTASHRRKNSTDEQGGIEMVHTGSGPCHVDLPREGHCAMPQSNMMVYCSRETLEEDRPHLCQKHARELLDNQTNSLYDQHHQRIGVCAHDDNGENPYYSKLPNMYNNREKAAYGTEGRAGTNVHFNYLKQMKQQPKESNTSRSTLSLPAVTYTFGKKGQGNKNIFRKTSNFFKPSCGNSSQSYTPTEDFLGAKGSLKSSSRKDSGKMKRLLLIACILMGVVLAIGGIVIGFVILQGQTQTTQDCGPDFVDCGDPGCIHLDDVCSDSMIYCPGYTLGTLCKQEDTENTSSVNVQADDVSQNRSNSVISNFVFDESNWVHFTNFSGAESMYQVIDKYMTFTSAQEECREYGGHLAHVTSVREQVFLEDYIRSLYPTSKSLYGTRGFWIGARRQRGSNTKNCMQYKQWRWIDNYGMVYGVVEGFSAFKNGKPDNFYNPEECLFMNTETTEPDVFDESFLKWDDLPCDLQGQSGLKPLCEVDLKKYPYNR